MKQSPLPTRGDSIPASTPLQAVAPAWFEETVDQTYALHVHAPSPGSSVASQWRAAEVPMQTTGAACSSGTEVHGHLRDMVARSSARTTLQSVEFETWPWVEVFDPREVDRENNHDPVNALRNELEAVLAKQPVEDGFDHPVEGILAEWLSTRILRDVERCIDLLVRGGDRDLATSILRGLGRLRRPGTDSWRLELVRDTLAHGGLEERDACVQAVELWDDPAFAPILAKHEERTTWLQDHIDEVLKRLEGTPAEIEDPVQARRNRKLIELARSWLEDDEEEQRRAWRVIEEGLTRRAIKFREPSE